MVLIKKYKIAMRGQRGTAISIPPVYMEELGLKPGDLLRAYREDEKLIFVPERRGVEK